jgi:hypothetical protein
MDSHDKKNQVEERIGVLLVHGIGEQGRFQHLEAEVCNLNSAIASAAGGEDARATLEINAGSSCSFSSTQESWRSDSEPALKIAIKDKGKLKVICFHEAWWADLGESSSWRNQIKFWVWSLAFWGTARYDKDDIPCPANGQMEMPKTDSIQTGILKTRIRWKDRARLFFIALTFAVATLSITIMNFFLKRFGLKNLPGSRTIVSYIGDVKLYRQQRPSKRGTASSINQLPRCAIRRRMICAVADMATADYSRWYILSHSLGSVVAFNALMETAHCLPNYLDRARLERVRGKEMAGPGRPEDWKGSEKDSKTGLPDTNCMLPRRPAWLRDDEVVYRDLLFKRNFRLSETTIY